MRCECEVCSLTGRQMTERQHAIWRRDAEGLTPEQCDVYRANWAAESNPMPSCRHRGDFVRRIECSSCKPFVSIKVLACAKHGECVIAPKPDMAQCCVICPDREA